MSNYYKIHSDTIGDLQAELGTSCPKFTWNLQTFDIIPGSTLDAQDLRDGGLSTAFDLAFDVRVAQFVGYTAVTLRDKLLNTKFTYLGDNYKVTQVDIAPGAEHITVKSNSLNQNA